MLLFEVFSSAPSYTVVTHNASKFVTKQVINGRTIVFIAGISDGGAEADIEFVELPKGVDIKDAARKGTYALTGSGGEMQVFSMVGHSMKEMVDVYQPERIFFTAEKEGKDSDKRAKLYSKLIKKFLPEYEPTEHDSGNAIHFKLYRK